MCASYLLGVSKASCVLEHMLAVLVDAKRVCTAQLADSICATLLSVYDGVDNSCLQLSQRPAEYVPGHDLLSSIVVGKHRVKLPKS
jgi:hypothetical protein